MNGCLCVSGATKTIHLERENMFCFVFNLQKVICFLLKLKLLHVCDSWKKTKAYNDKSQYSEVIVHKAFKIWHKLY